MMALLKMWCLLPFAALLLLSIIPTIAEVVKSMSDCPGFLLQETPPRVPGILEGGNILNQNRYKPICQTLNDSRSFVTLYDTTNRIPVFSASKYKGSKGGRPKTSWNIEPQLEDLSEDKNMTMSTRCKLYENQAGERDYRIKKKKNTINKEFDRGHLLPSSYGHTENVKKSTFTLTNVVPQAGPFNKGSWSRMEQCIKCVMDDYCINNNGQMEGFLVIGAQPGNNNLKNRVNIPSMLWSAFCCYSRSKGWLASAHWGQNIPGGDEYLPTKTLDELNNELSTTSSKFEVFPGTRCPNNATVTQFYQDVNSKSEGRCNCPPLISTTSAAPTTASTPPVSTTAPFTTTSAPPSSTSVPLSTTPETTSPPSTTATTHTTTETPTTPVQLTTTSIHSTTRPQTATTPPPTTVQTTTTKTTTATTSTTTTTTTTTTKKKDDDDKEEEKEGDKTDQNINEGPSDIGGLAPPSLVSGAVASFFGALGSLLGTLFGAIGSAVTGVAGPTNSANNVFPINLPPVIVAPKTETTPHPKVYPTKTIMSDITSIPPKVVSTIPVITVSVAASTSKAPPDDKPVVPTSLHKTTIPEKEKNVTVRPVITTQQSSAIPTSTMSVIVPSIPPKVVSTIPAITVSVTARISAAPPDNMSVVPTSLHKTTIPEKDITVHPANTTQQTTAIPPLNITDLCKLSCGSMSTLTAHFTTTSAPPSSPSVPLSTTPETTSPPSTTATTHTTTETPTTPVKLTTPSTHSTTRLQTATATNSTTTTTKKNDEEGEGDETEQDVNEGPSNIGGLAPPISDTVASFFGALGSLLGNLFGAIGGAFTGVAGPTNSANNVFPINLPPATLAPKTETTPHPKEYPTKTIMSVITSIPPKVVSSTSKAPPDDKPVVPTSLHKTTIPEKEKNVTVRPVITTQQSSAIPSLNITDLYKLCCGSTSTLTASSQTDVISEEQTSPKPSSATATVSSVPQTATTTFTDN